MHRAFTDQHQSAGDVLQGGCQEHRGLIHNPGLAFERNPDKILEASNSPS